MIHGQCRALLGVLFVFLLVVFNAGCSGGGGGGASESNLGGNNPPVIKGNDQLEPDPGGIKMVVVGESVTLKGSIRKGSTKGLTISYQWTFISKPDGSQAELLNANTQQPSFTTDAAGSYTIKLVIGTGKNTSMIPVIAYVEAFATSADLSDLKPRFANHNVKSSTCASVDCHNGTSITAATPKSVNHIATSNMCQACHNVMKFKTIPFVNHTQVMGNCSDCHNGVIAIGKSPKHVLTEVKCDTCHNTTGFVKLGADGRYDHTGVNSGCDACHNGIVATGKNEGHIATKGDCALCHIPAYFTPATFDHSSITTNCSACHNNEVDAAARGVPVRIPPATPHIDIVVSTNPTVLVDCGMCHNTRTFVISRVKGSPDQFDYTNHADIKTKFGVTCESCHDNINGRGVSSNHMPIPAGDPTITPPGPQDCDTCHIPGSFASGFFDHLLFDASGNKVVVITDNCATCHDGVISTGLSANHFPVDNTVDCSICHTYTTDPVNNPPTFTGASFDHTNTAITACEACHDGIKATGKSQNSAGVAISHIPTVKDCSVCHDSSIGDFEVASFDHGNIKNGCGGCHSGKFTTRNTGKVLSKPTAHIPTEQDCYFCHTTDISLPFKPAKITHLGITDNCVSCHDGNYTSFNARGKSSATNPLHITTNGACGACHNTRTFKPAYIDHASPAITGPGITCASCHDGAVSIGSPGDIIHTNAATANKDCGVCHVPGTFTTAVFDHTGIVDNCVSCHDGPTRTATGKPADPVHTGTIPDCSTCHNTTTFAGARYDHTGIVSNCAVCHDGITALGKSLNHVPTVSDCSACHVTAGFLPAGFDHVGIVDNCQSCHDGVFATGKSVGHPLTTGDCGLCHTPAGFNGAVVDHTGVVKDCVGCHDGSIAKGKNPTHLATTLDCYFCHTTATFVGGTWIHGNDVAGNCLSCHSIGKGATPLPPAPGHFATGPTVQCDACHTTAGWAPASNFVHCPPGTTPVPPQVPGTISRPVINNTCEENVYPGDHRRPLACISCHADNTSVIDFTILRRDPNPLYDGFCASCHAKDFQAEGDHINGNNGTVTDNKDCSGGPNGCHRIGNLNGEGF